MYHCINASDVVSFPGKEMQSLHVAVNDAIRMIFSYHRCKNISITDIFAKRKRVFDKRLSQIGNAVLSFLDASSHLYKWVCPSVRPSVHGSVTPVEKPPRGTSNCRFWLLFYSV